MAENDPTRRTLFAMGGLGALALAGTAGMAQAAEATGHVMSETEKANARLVDVFCTSMNDIEKAAMAFSDDAVLRIGEGRPPVIGSRGLINLFHASMGADGSVETITHETFARGPLVANVRTDIIRKPGKPDTRAEVVAVFIVKGGKIVAWDEYVVTKA